MPAGAGALPDIAAGAAHGAGRSTAAANPAMRLCVGAPSAGTSAAKDNHAKPDHQVQRLGDRQSS